MKKTLLKILALMTILAMVLSIAACSKKPDPEPEPDPVPENTYSMDELTGYFRCPSEDSLLFLGQNGDWQIYDLATAKTFGGEYKIENDVLIFAGDAGTPPRDLAITDADTLTDPDMRTYERYELSKALPDETSILPICGYWDYDNGSGNYYCIFADGTFEVRNSEDAVTVKGTWEYSDEIIDLTEEEGSKSGLAYIDDTTLEDIVGQRLTKRAD